MKKKCNCCNILKPLSEFHKDNSKKDGVSTYCKYCRNKQQKEYVKNNKALVKNRQKKYYEKYP